MPETQRDLAAEIRVTREKVQQMTVHRDAVIRQEATEAQKLKDARDKLTELGIAGVDKLSIAELEALEAKSLEELDAILSSINAKVAEGEKVIAELEATN